MDDNYDFPADAKAANEIVMEKCRRIPVYPILKVGDERVIGVGGFKKKLLHEGQGVEFLRPGDEVEGIIFL